MIAVKHNKNLNNICVRDEALLTRHVLSDRPVPPVPPPDVIPDNSGTPQFSLPYSGTDLHINQQIIWIHKSYRFHYFFLAKTNYHKIIESNIRDGKQFNRLNSSSKLIC